MKSNVWKNKGRIPMFRRITLRILIIGKILCRIKIVGRKTRNLNGWSDAS